MRLKVVDLELMALDRAIAQELELPVGETIPRYTTDLNEAIKLYDDDWQHCYSFEEENLWIVVLDNFEAILGDTLCLAICKARFPHLFEERK